MITKIRFGGDSMLDFIRIACAVPPVKVGDVRKNTEDICEFIARADEQNVDLLLFPELAMTGYSCGDLFLQEKLLEGANVEVPVGASSKNAMVPLTTINTKNILFICGGAFGGIEKIIQNRMGHKVIGFDAEVQSKLDKTNDELLRSLMPQDLLKYGLIPEFIGRLPVTVALDKLDADALVRVLTEPRNAIIKQYKKMLKMDVHFRNCGRSGATTVDFLPATERDFVRVERAIKEIQQVSYAPIVFSIMLGTNDSANFGPNGSPVSNEDYKKNLMTMIGRLRELCPEAVFVLQRPIWYSPNTHNGAQYLVAGQKRMVDYTNILIEIALENDDVYMGDSDAFDYFQQKHRKYMFAEDGKAGIFYLHPNEAGARKLARFWARGIVNALK